MDKIKKFFTILGPGLITGASDDDPTAIATYSQSGAQFGYHQLWTALYTIPFMITMQEMCGRIGLVTGKGIAFIIRKNYPKPLLYIALLFLLVANLINIGADIGAIAETAQLIWHIPFIIYVVAITILLLLLQLFVGYKIFSKILKYATISLLAYVATGFFTKQNWFSIFTSILIPYLSLKKDFLINLTAILGTNISPYLFFWQASEEVEENVEKHKMREVDRGRPTIKKADIFHLRLDTAIGMIFSNIIVLFIEITAAGTLAKHGITNIHSASQAAQSLQPVAGSASFALFAIGILASGLLAVPVLSSSAAYAVAETFKQTSGLNQKFPKAPWFYALITVTTLVGASINFLPIKPFILLIYSAAVNGILTPFLLVIILFITNNKKIMGTYTNTKVTNIMGIILALLMVLCTGGLLYSLINK